jgi:hypothetical protein
MKQNAPYPSNVENFTPCLPASDSPSLPPRLSPSRPDISQQDEGSLDRSSAKVRKRLSQDGKGGGGGSGTITRRQGSSQVQLTRLFDSLDLQKVWTVRDKRRDRT